MGGLVLLDAVSRGIAVGSFAIMGLAFANSRQSMATRWIGVLFFSTTIGHALSNCVGLRLQTPQSDLLTWALSAAGTGMFWTFAVTQFEDAPKIRPAHIFAPIGALGLASLGKLVGYPQNTPIWLVYNTLSVGLVAHALFVIWGGWQGDLVEGRRRLRAPVMAAAAIYVMLTAAGDEFANLGHRILALNIFQGVFLGVLGVLGGYALLRLDPAMVREPISHKESAPPDAAGQEPASTADVLTLKRLAKAMDDDEVWRREDLSIRSLAEMLSLPEHKLRRLINGALGYRNFAAFVNARRIDAAKADLVDPDQGRRPISAIAYDLGFGSLGPFNRAFRDATGMSPSEWRATQGLADF